MITRRTKIQLLVFVFITLVGVSFVGAKYARLGSLFATDHYTVVAHFAASGGIYQGAEVDYRGVKVGEVGRLQLTQDGVDVYLDIGRTWDRVPSDTRAVVDNRSAVGEQYVDLQPRSDTAPYLQNHSEIARADTSTPLPTEKLLGDTARTVGSVDRRSLSVTVDELGKAFGGTGRDLQQILDTGTSFISAANDNFDVTANLIRDSNTVLRTQVGSADAIRGFSRRLSLFTGTLAGSNKDLVSLIENGSASATQLRTFLEENQVDLGELLSEVVTTGQVVRAHLPGLRQALVAYPGVVEGGFSVVDKDPSSGLYNVHFGLVMTGQAPCTRGYESTVKRPPQDNANRSMNTKAHCSEPITQGNARGEQNLDRAPASYRAPVVGSYDDRTGRVTWGNPDAGAPSYQPAPASLGGDAWKWLYLQPLTAGS